MAKFGTPSGNLALALRGPPVFGPGKGLARRRRSCSGSFAAITFRSVAINEAKTVCFCIS